MVCSESSAPGQALQGSRWGVSKLMHNPQHSLRQWGKQNWRTKSGKKSSETGERYLPAAAIASLTPAEYARTTGQAIFQATRKHHEKDATVPQILAACQAHAKRMPNTKNNPQHGSQLVVRMYRFCWFVRVVVQKIRVQVLPGSPPIPLISLHIF